LNTLPPFGTHICASTEIRLKRSSAGQPGMWTRIIRRWDSERELFHDHIVQYFKISSIVEYSTRRRPWRRERGVASWY